MLPVPAAQTGPPLVACRQAVLVEKDSGTELAVHRGRRRWCKTTTLTLYNGKVAAFGLDRDIVVATCLAFAELTREKRR